MLTPCLGRERVHLQLDDALSSARWVSVVGPPGSGKTLLVRHLAARTGPRPGSTRRGCASDAILAACLHGVGAEAAPGDSTSGALGRALDGTETLLVVDGVDIDADGLGPALQQLVETTSGARIAVTARTMAGQPGERVVRVGPLPVPSSHEPLAGPAVDLFLRRVEAAGGHPVDLVSHERDVRRLLTATGGLPLLIEQMAVQIALVGSHQRGADGLALRGGAGLLRPARRGAAPVLPPAGPDEHAGQHRRAGRHRRRRARRGGRPGGRSGQAQPPGGAARRPPEHALADPPARRVPHRLDRRRERGRGGPDPVGRPGGPRRPQLRRRRCAVAG